MKLTNNATTPASQTASSKGVINDSKQSSIPSKALNKNTEIKGGANDAQAQLWGIGEKNSSAKTRDSKL
jgi:hypothetical protein